MKLCTSWHAQHLMEDMEFLRKRLATDTRPLPLLASWFFGWRVGVPKHLDVTHQGIQLVVQTCSMFKCGLVTEAESVVMSAFI